MQRDGVVRLRVVKRKGYDMKRKLMRTMKACVLIALALALAFSLAACSGANQTAATGDAAGELLLNVKTKDIDGNDFDVSANKGGALTVFNIWATWCGPCIEELPDIAKIAKEYESKNVRFIGILTDGAGGDGKIDELACKEAKTLLADAKVSYPSIIPDETMMKGIIEGTHALPSTYIIGPDGKLVDNIVGRMDYDAWNNAVKKALES
jgi:thiol-disulfide isomerase/thioredoxin